MANQYKNFEKGIALIPKASSDNDTKGDLEVLTTGKLQYHNGTDSSPVVTEDHTATLKNKTFDLSDNTLVATSTELRNAVTGTTGTGDLVFNDTPSLTDAALTQPTINGGDALLTTSTKLNYLFYASGTEGDSTSSIVFSAGPLLTSPSANEYRIRNSALDILTLSKESGSSYTVSIPASAPTANTSLIYTGSNYVWGEPGKAPTITTLTSGTGTYNPPSNVKYIKLRMVGGGGGGGGANTTGDTAGGGGGSGAYLEAVINAPISATSYSIGVAGTSGGTANDGGNGGATTFGSYTANGGTGGSRGTSFGKGAGGAGGTTSSLPIGGIGFSAAGQGGGAGGADDVNGDTGGIGGGSLLGGGAKSTGVGVAGQSASVNSGGGGSGGGATGAAGTAGGSGGSGIIIIEEYYNY